MCFFFQVKLAVVNKLLQCNELDLMTIIHFSDTRLKINKRKNKKKLFLTLVQFIFKIEHILFILWEVTTMYLCKTSDLT